MLKRQKFQNRGHWRARPIRAAEARGRSGAGARLGCGALEKTRRCRKGCKGGRRLYGSACNSSPGARCKIQALSALLPALRAKDAPAAQTCPAGRGSIPGQGPKSTPGKVTLIGCPKLDGVDYSEKLAEILRQNDIESVQVVRMEVPCCGGLVQAVRQALQCSGKCIPWQVVTLSVDGQVRSEV